MYLKALVEDLKAAGVIAEDVDVASVDELLGVLERTSGDTARLIDIPPLELQELRTSLAELRSHGDSLPSSQALAALFAALRRTAEAENRSLLEVSAGIGLAFLTSARKVSGRHVVAPYREDWKPLQHEGRPRTRGAWGDRTVKLFRGSSIHARGRERNGCSRSSAPSSVGGGRTMAARRVEAVAGRRSRLRGHSAPPPMASAGGASPSRAQPSRIAIGGTR